MAFEKLKVITCFPTIKELFVEVKNCAEKHLVIEQFSAELKQIKVVGCKIKMIYLLLAIQPRLHVQVHAIVRAENRD